MQKKVLISLVSEYTIPNIQLIKELEHQIDVFLFITSEKMEYENENRTDWIIHSVQLAKEKTKRIVINPHNLSDIETTFEKTAFNKEDEHHVNLTCGTKLMALVTLNFFSNFPKANFYYVPQGVSHYQLIYPKEKRTVINFNYRITLFEYLSACGLKIESKENLHKPIKETKKLMQKVLLKEGNIKKLPEIRNAKSYKRSEDKKYFSGGWFEEYVFNTIKTHFELKDKEIGIGVRLQNQRTENEYDVVFVKDNQIYVLECKAYFGYTKLKAKIEKDLYKLGALDDDFGLNTRSVYVTTIDLEKSDSREFKTLQNRAYDLRVKLFHASDLDNDKFLNEILS